MPDSCPVGKKTGQLLWQTVIQIDYSSLETPGTVALLDVSVCRPRSDSRHLVRIDLQFTIAHNVPQVLDFATPKETLLVLGKEFVSTQLCKGPTQVLLTFGHSTAKH